MQRVLVNYIVTAGRFKMYDSLVAIRQVRAAAILDLTLFDLVKQCKEDNLPGGT